MRGFIPMALSSFMKGSLSFLGGPAKFQSQEKILDMLKLGQGVMPRSFRVHHHNPTQKTGSLRSLLADTAIEKEKDVDYHTLSQLCPKFPRLKGLYSWVTSSKSNDIPKSLSDWIIDFMPSCSSYIFDKCPPRMNLVRSFCSDSSADDFSRILQKMAKESIKDSGADNTSLISLDDLEKFLVTYPNGIGRLRRWCKLNGMHIDLSTIFGVDRVIFTTPPAGSYRFNFKYLGRTLEICLYGRNLYVMGWRNPNGTFEIKDSKDKRKNFMSGDATVVKFKKNYSFLCPKRDVAETRMGLLALREAFEVLYKSTGQTNEVRAAVGTFAVHTSEAGRLQSVFKDVCISAFNESMDKVGAKNRLWIQRYDTYAVKEMDHIEALRKGKSSKGVEACLKAVAAGVEISDEIILNQIRIFPRDGCNHGECKLETAPSDPHEDDPVSGKDSSSESSRSSERSRGTKWESIALSSKEKGKKKRPGLKEVPIGDGGSNAAAVPLYLLEDWCPPEAEEEEHAEVKVVGHK